MLTPSARIDASASSSAVAQSTVRSSGCVEHVRALLARALELPVDGEVRPAVASSAAFSSRSRSSGTAVCAFARGARRRRLGLRLDEVLLGLQRVQRRLQLVHVAAWSAPRRSPASTTPRSTSVLRPDLAHGRVRRDLLVHQRLRERRLVAFVVAVAAVADQVDQEVALELRAIGERQPRRLDARLGIVGVDVDDRDLEPARQAARVRRAVRRPRSRS